MWGVNDNVGVHKYARLKMMQRADFGFHLPSQFGLQPFKYEYPSGSKIMRNYTWDRMLNFTSSSIGIDGPRLVADGGDLRGYVASNIFV